MTTKPSSISLPSWPLLRFWSVTLFHIHDLASGTKEKVEVLWDELLWTDPNRPRIEPPPVPFFSTKTESLEKERNEGCSAVGSSLLRVVAHNFPRLRPGIPRRCDRRRGGAHELPIISFTSTAISLLLSLRSPAIRLGTFEVVVQS